MKTLSIDLETYSDLDIKQVGVYRYAEHESTEVLLFGYSIDGAPVVVIDLTDFEPIPDEVIEMLTRSDVLKFAYNAEFEFTMLSKFLKKYSLGEADKMNIDQWQDTAVQARYASLPADLGSVSKILFPKDVDKQKDARGKALITFFCKPCKPTKKNEGRTRNYPWHDKEKWEEFKSYNGQDVVAEQEIAKQLTKGGFVVPEIEWSYWQADVRINQRGIKVDLDLVKSAIKMDTEVKNDAYDEMREISGIANPNSLPQLKGWLEEQGLVLSGLGKEIVQDVLKTEDLEPHVRRILELRLLISGTAVKKYQTLERCVCDDGRVRGLLMFYGASRTGREAGRLVQPQNLKRIDIEDEDELDLLRDAVKNLDYDTVNMLAPDNILSQLIRTAFIPEEGHKIVVCDLSAIEARVTAWLAGEKWRLKVFEDGGDIYCASASMMFGVPVKKHGVNGHLRQKGKIAELALGYGGGVGALVTMGGDKMGLTEPEMEEIKVNWRAASPSIVKFWWAIGNAALDTVRYGDRHAVGPIQYYMMGKTLVCQLPGGRCLHYLGAKISEGKYGNDVISFWGVNQETRQWTRLQTYGPKLVENIVQATSRDILFHALYDCDQANCPTVLHVHDEIVADVPKDFDKDWLFDTMTKDLVWTKGLPLNAEAQEAAYYSK